MTLPALTLSDRCDRCIAQARVSVRFTAGGTLQFCKHHFERHEGKLRAEELVVDLNDQRAELVDLEPAR